MVWGLTHEVLSSPEARPHTLTTAEVQRALQFQRQGDRADFVAARLLARVCAVRAGVVGGWLELRQHCRHCGGPHGVPDLAGWPLLRVSLAHTSGAVIAGVSERPIGVDIEPLRGLAPAEVAPVLGDAERSWLDSDPDDTATIRVWCRKEAAAKALGGGLEIMRDIGVCSAGEFSALASGMTWQDRLSDGYVTCVAGQIPTRAGLIERISSAGVAPPGDRWPRG